MGVAIAALVVVAAVVAFLAMSKSGAKLMAAQRARVEAARPAMGKVTAVESTAMRKGVTKDPLVIVSMDVREDSGASYPVQAVWFVEIVAVPRVQPGQEVPIRIDAQDPKVVYPGEPWAEQGWGFERIVTLKRAQKG